jgi:hypothetical protein
VDLWAGNPDLLRLTKEGNFYDLQARALLGGRLSVPNGSLGVEGFIHGGREYTYFGIFPSLLRMPVLIVAHSLDGRLTAVSMLLAWLATGAFASLLLWRIRILLRGSAVLGRAEAASCALLVVAVTGGSVLMYLAATPAVFEEELAWSVALTIGVVFALLGVARGGRGRGVDLGCSPRPGIDRLCLRSRHLSGGRLPRPRKRQAEVARAALGSGSRRVRSVGTWHGDGFEGGKVWYGLRLFRGRAGVDSGERPSPQLPCRQRRERVRCPVPSEHPARLSPTLGHTLQHSVPVHVVAHHPRTGCGARRAGRDLCHGEHPCVDAAALPSRMLGSGGDYPPWLHPKIRRSSVASDCNCSRFTRRSRLRLCHGSLLDDIETIWLGWGYDSEVTRERLAARLIDDAIIAKRRMKGEAKGKNPQRMGMRWPVERTNAWLAAFGQLRRNTDRKTIHRLAQFGLAVAILLTGKLIDYRNRWPRVLAPIR